jgi:hypothetical protein
MTYGYICKKYILNFSEHLCRNYFSIRLKI